MLGKEHGLIYYGFLWVASEKILRLDDLDVDESYVPPPEILLPKLGMTSYQSLVEYGKSVDFKHFKDRVNYYRMVSFKEFTYCFRKAFPSEGDPIIQIKMDLRPDKYDVLR